MKTSIGILKAALNISPFVPKSEWGSRNRIACFPDETEKLSKLELMVENGYMSRGMWTPEIAFFHVTRKGCRFIGLNENKIINAMDCIRHIEPHEKIVERDILKLAEKCGIVGVNPVALMNFSRELLGVDCG